MTGRAPSWERQAHLRVIAWEAALTGTARNGARPAADVAWLIAHDAIRAPATAARCPAVLAVLPLEVLAAITGQPPPAAEVSRLTRCQACGGPLDPGSRADKRFCSARCRKRHQRAKHRRTDGT